MIHKKKILISSNSVWNVVNFRKGVVLELVNRGFEVIVVAPEDNNISELHDLNCKYINMGQDNLSMYKNLLKYCHDNENQVCKSFSHF